MNKIVERLLQETNEVHIVDRKFGEQETLCGKGQGAIDRWSVTGDTLTERLLMESNEKAFWDAAEKRQNGYALYQDHDGKYILYSVDNGRLYWNDKGSKDPNDFGGRDDQPTDIELALEDIRALTFIKASVF